MKAGIIQPALEPEVHLEPAASSNHSGKAGPVLENDPGLLGVYVNRSSSSNERAVGTVQPEQRRILALKVLGNGMAGAGVPEVPGYETMATPGTGPQWTRHWSNQVVRRALRVAGAVSGSSGQECFG
jgi:hypothetical protein